MLLYTCAHTVAFPLDEFKAFINEKPTIENFEFRVKTAKYGIAGINENTYRYFKLTLQTGLGFALYENRNSPTRSLSYYSGQFGNTWWHTMNSNDVITETGPLRFFGGHIGAALDALNLGFLDLGSNKVMWSGLEFSSQNENGAKLHGRLQLSAQGEPANLLMDHEFNGKLFHLQVTYEFGTRTGLPAFFPSRIKIDQVSPAGPVHVSDYDILALKMSSRNLTFADVDYASWTNGASREFRIISNDMFLVQREDGATKLTPLIKMTNNRDTSSHKLPFIIVIVFVSAVMAIVFLKASKIK